VAAGALVACVALVGPAETSATAPSVAAVVFERGGELFSVSLSGGTATRLTRTRTDMYEPAISPDHRRVAFTLPRSEGIATMRIDGSDRRVVTRGPDADPAWSPDGRMIYFARTTGTWRVKSCESIFAVPARGGDARRITRGHRGGHYDPAPSPDGKAIAVSHWNACEGGTSSPHLRVFTPSGRPTHALARLPHNGFGEYRFERSCPAWSPDGKRLAFLSNSDLAVVNRDGSRYRRLIRGGGFLYYRVPAWAPNGAWIAWVRPTPAGKRGRSRWEVVVVRPNGSGLRRLFVTANDDQLSIAGWLPD
jgi:Tol biopolymer transport system component